MVSEDFPGGAGGLLAGFAAGSRVAGYLLEEQIGAGGMAVVFCAVDERLGRRVALKVLAPALAADQSFRQRFIRESRAAAAVDDPHIIPVHDAGEAGGVLFIAMRYVPGGDVRTLLNEEGPLAPARAAAIISPVASALDAAHAAGLVHRDVKPANMLLDSRPDRPDHVYLSDFGLSKGTLSSVGLTGTGQFLGTPNYTAPEQIEGRAVDGRTDQYALACAAFEVLTGEAPFQRDQAMAVIWAHLSQQPPSASSRRPDLPAAVDEVFARALAKDSEGRYVSCREFADALRRALGLVPYHSGPAVIPTPIRPATGIPRSAGPATEGMVIPADAAAGSGAEPLTARSAMPDGPAVVPVSTTTVITDPGRSGRDSGESAMPNAREAAEDIAVGVATGGSAADQAKTAAGWPTVSARTSALTVIADGTSIDSARGARPVRHRRRIVQAIVGGVGILAAVAVVLIATASSHDHKPTSSAGRSPGSSPARKSASPPAGLVLATFADPDSAAVNALAVRPDGATLATGGNDGHTYLWDVATGRRTVTLTDPGSFGVYAVAFSPSGRTLAAGDANGSTYLWDVAAGRRIATLTDPQGNTVGAVAFSPSGRTLAAGDANGSTYLWDVAAGRRIATLTDPGSSGVSAVAFSPNGRTLATGDGNGSTYLWDVATGRRIATLTDPGTGGVGAVAFSPTGRTLAAGDLDASTYLWDVATGTLAATLIDPAVVVSARWRSARTAPRWPSAMQIAAPTCGT